MTLYCPGILMGDPVHSVLEIQRLNNSNKLDFFNINHLKHEFITTIKIAASISQKTHLSFHYKYQ